MRRKARVDANHAQIRSTLRACGWTVVDLSGAGNGIPDLLACKHGRIELVEVKDGSKPPSARALTADEQRIATLLAGAGVTVRVITSIDQAVGL